MRGRAATLDGLPIRQRIVDWRLLEQWLRSHAFAGSSAGAGRPPSGDGHDVVPPEDALPHLTNACIASSFEVALQAEALAAGMDRLDTGSVDLAAILDNVVAVLQPLAQGSGIGLLREGARVGVEHPQGDARRLHSLLFHLVARALAAETPGGHVRVAASWCAGEACIRVLSRIAESSVHPATLPEARDLAPARYLLSTMGGALLLEPRRAGYQPVCMVLRTPPSAAALRVA